MRIFHRCSPLRALSGIEYVQLYVPVTLRIPFFLLRREHSPSFLFRAVCAVLSPLLEKKPISLFEQIQARAHAEVVSL